MVVSKIILISIITILLMSGHRRAATIDMPAETTWINKGGTNTSTKMDILIAEDNCSCHMNQTEQSVYCRVSIDTATFQTASWLFRYVASKAATGMQRLVIQLVEHVYEIESGRSRNRLERPHRAKQEPLSGCGQLCELELLGYPWSTIPSSLFLGISSILKSVTIRRNGGETSESTPINSSSRNMAIENFTFSELHEVEELDLSQNTINTIPKHEFCFLPKLQKLDISDNLLNYSSQIGFGTHEECESQADRSPQCRSHLQVLDISRNRLRILSNNSFCALTNLSHLYLSGNGLREFQGSLNSNLGTLMYLDLSRNMLNSIPVSLWKHVSSIAHLDISRNKLRNVNESTFQHLGFLKVLVLSANDIRDIDVMSFRRFHNLEYLRLEMNKISCLQPNTFIAMSQLILLNLENNELTSINATTFAGLLNLQRLLLQYNLIEYVDQNTFECCPDLLELTLNGNRLTSLPDLSLLNRLQFISLSVNPLVNISIDAFIGLSNLTNLDMGCVGVNSFPPTIFNSIPQIAQLSLDGNRIKDFPPHIFSNSTNLIELYLEDNILSSIPDLTNTSLRFLQLQSNALKFLDTMQLPTTLKRLDVSYNSITDIHQSGFARLTNLEIINFQSNNLKSVSDFKFPISMKEIVLEGNQIASLDAAPFMKLKFLTRLSLQGNRIKTLEETSLSNIALISEVPTVSIRIARNPIICDCRMLWITKFAKQRHYHSNIMIDYDSIKCCVNDLRKPQCQKPGYRFDKKLNTVEENSFLCLHQPNNNVNTEDCKNRTSCKLSCPEQCNCYTSSNMTTVVTFCSQRQLLKVPENISSFTTTIYLDGNNLTELTVESFVNNPSVDILLLNNSNLEAIGNRTFAVMSGLRVLHLQDNQIKVLQTDTFAGLMHLALLNLSSNRLPVLPEGVFYHLKSLANLQVANNILQALPSLIVKNASSIRWLGLVGNPWTCSCQNMATYSKWQQTNFLKVIDDQRVLCHIEAISDNKNKMPTMKLADFGFAFCQHQATFPLTLPMAIFGSILVILTISTALIYFYRYEIQVLLYSKYRFRLSSSGDPDQEDDQSLYDAFVAYSNMDEQLVVDELMPRLEGPLIDVPYKLCLHQRDFAVGAFISESIQEAVERSRRTIIIMSRNFVQSNWCRYEFKMAHYQMLQDKQKRVIMIVLGGGRDIPDKELDSEMKLYFKTNTYLEWGDRLFWHKLYYAMPDRPKAKVTPES